ncbi:hypothetical protein FOA52_013820 [Chlamydomonas sp. UWO 241]|nr:hypothetical protein FOA52_013820 [Chlamydomonas sp. UWO 241]
MARHHVIAVAVCLVAGVLVLTVGFAPEAIRQGLPRLPRIDPSCAMHGIGGDATATTDVWVLAGQSNTVGENQADGQPMPHSVRPWPSRVLAFSPDGAWCDAQPSVHFRVHGYQDRHSVGPDMSFARAVVAACASGARTEAALSSLPGAHLAGMLWVQGESNGLEAATARAYGANLRAFIAAARSDFARHNAKHFTFVMGVMATLGRTPCFPEIEEIRRQQLALQLPNLLKVDMAGHEFFEQTYAPSPPALVHLTKNGQATFGAAMAHAVLKAQPAGEEARRVRASTPAHQPW